MGARYHVAKSVLKIGTATFDMETGPAAKGVTREACDVTSLADAIKQFIPGALTEEDEFTVTIYDPGVEGRPKTSDAPAKVEFEVVLSRGQGTTDDKSANFSYEKGIITKVSPPNHEGAGERKATVDITIRPNGEQPAAGGGGSGDDQQNGGGAGGSGNGGVSA